jgi:hypothetical protein
MENLQSKLDEIKSKESFLEKIKRFIPGYDGYVNRDNARELDKILRDKLANMLEENKTVIKNIILDLTQSNRLFEVQNMDKLDQKNQNAIAKLRSAARGYSGAFDVVKIKDDKLHRLYEFDAGLVGYVNEINELFKELEEKIRSKDDAEQVTIQLSDRLDAFISIFNDREELLRTL